MRYRSSIPLVVALGWCALPVSLTQAQSFHGVPMAAVVDAEGKQVGYLHSSSHDVYFELPDSTLVRIDAQPDGFEAYDQLYYTSSDCTGAPYIMAGVPATDLVPDAIVGPPGLTVYRQDLSAAPVMQGVLSVNFFCVGQDYCSPYGCNACGPVTTVAADAQTGALVITVTDASGFPSSGTIEIQYQSASYGTVRTQLDYSKAGDVFTLTSSLPGLVSQGTPVRLSGDPCLYEGFLGPVVALAPLVPVVDLNVAFTAPFHAVAASVSNGAACCGDCNGDAKVTIDEILTGVNEALNGCPAQ